MSTSRAGKKLQWGVVFRQKKNSKPIWQWKTSGVMITNAQKESGKTWQPCLEKNRIKIGIANRCWYVIDNRENYQVWDLSRDSLVCKG